MYRWIRRPGNAPGDSSRWVPISSNPVAKSWMVDTDGDGTPDAVHVGSKGNLSGATSVVVHWRTAAGIDTAFTIATPGGLGAALTLPGIAGVILTIGVGIDSNVLIFERIREELRAGKTAVSAVVTSFSRVFITLVDTHLAALISAVFLFLFGTGPVKGFAVTLVIGLVSNMFTAVFVSRTLFEWVLNRKQRAETALSI